MIPLSMEMPSAAVGVVAPEPVAAIAQPSRGIAAWANKYGGAKVRAAKASDPDRLDLIYTGIKDAGKTVGVVGIPVRKGKRYFLAFDKRTKEGIVDYYGPDAVLDDPDDKPRGQIKCNVVFPLVTPDERTGYPGFDPNKPATAEEVIANAMTRLEEIERRGDGDVIVLEHFQRAYEGIGRALVLNAAGWDVTETEIPYQKWGPRAAALGPLLDKVSAIAQVSAVTTGYSQEEELVMLDKTEEEMEAEKRARKTSKVAKTKLVRKIVTPKWVDFVQRDQSVWCHGTWSRESEGTGEQQQSADRYWIEVMKSKNALFPKGVKVEVTNTNLSVFWSRNPPDVIKRARLQKEMDRQARLVSIEATMNDFLPPEEAARLSASDLTPRQVA